jgi:6-phosphogluconolactonase
VSVPGGDDKTEMLSVFPDLAALTRGAADLFVERLRRSAAPSPFHVALAGGETPEGLYKLLAAGPYQDRIDWQRVHIFWGDERCVPPEDSRSNERMARQSLLDRVPVPPEHVHPIRCQGSAQLAAREYGRLLQAFFGSQGATFDLVLLGLGSDGHTASLFPGSASLLEAHELVVATEGGDPDLPRVTMTALAINRSACVAFLVSGEGKAHALQSVLEGVRDPIRWPAQLIRPQGGDLYWLVDHAAASLLKPLPAASSGR